jgi:ribonuclease D
MHQSLSDTPTNRHTNKPTTLVEDYKALQSCVQALADQHTLAFDLEFDSHRHAYGVTLCLIQIATPEVCFIIDPLADIDLSAVYQIFENVQVQKIVHSPGEDLRLLHSLGCYPKNLFDTDVAAKLLNYEQTSLSAMLEAKLGYSLNKSQQRSNWLRRPLTREQVQYAAEDVTGLHALKGILIAEAEQKGLMPFIEEEQAALSTTIYQPERKDFFLKTGDVANLSPYDQYVLNALFVYRDELAREINRPAYQIMDEALLRDVAGGRVLAADAPYAKGVFGGFKNDRFGKQLAGKLNAIHREAETQALSRKRPPRQYSSDSRTSKAELLEQREATFTPIQQSLIDRFGEHAARFILSNGTVTEMMRGNLKISDWKRQYKKDLVCQIAREKSIDLSAYL